MSEAPDHTLLVERERAALDAALEQKTGGAPVLHDDSPLEVLSLRGEREEQAAGTSVVMPRFLCASLPMSDRSFMLTS